MKNDEHIIINVYHVVMVNYVYFLMFLQNYLPLMSYDYFRWFSIVDKLCYKRRL